MDALIRSAALSNSRTRLPARVSGSMHADNGGQAAQDRLREALERELRDEFTARAQQAEADERERAREEGYARGLEQGREAALAEAMVARAEMDARVEEALDLLRTAHQTAVDQWEAQVGAVAFAALCKLVGRQAGTELFVRSVVEQVCAPLRAGTAATVRLHPRDVLQLGGLVQGGTLSLGVLGLDVVDDASLELGGCVVESSIGVYDGTLHTQLKRLSAVLTGMAE
jgi:flagellar assembly protein FliH